MIGILDWGIGGLGLVKELAKFGKFDYIYFSDSGFTPYGKVDETTLKNRVNQVIDFLFGKGVSHVVIACNAAGSVIPSQKNTFNIVEIGHEIISTYNSKKLTIIGGNRIIESGKLDLGYNHQLAATQRLSAIVEAGQMESSREEILSLLNSIQPHSKIYLGCTHYPALIPFIQSQLSTTDFIDPAVELAKQLHPYLSYQKQHAEIFTTGSREQLINSTKLAFGLKLELSQVKKISL